MHLISQTQLPKVVFFPIKSAQEKLKKIIAVAESYVKRQKPLLFITADKLAEDYLDNLLWQHKPQSFIPHIVSDIPCLAKIVVTCKLENLNQAYGAFNLTPFSLTQDLGFRTLYEFEDHTSKEKLEASKIRFENYRRLDLHISYS